MDAGREGGGQRLALALRLLVGGVFVVSGGLKALHPDAFAAALASYELFPAAVIAALRWLLPPLEVALGLLFAAGVRTPLLARLLVGLVSLGTLAVVAGLALGGAVDCGCFPTAGAAHAVGAGFFLRNLTLIAVTIWIAERADRPAARAAVEAAAPAPPAA